MMTEALRDMLVNRWIVCLNAGPARLPDEFAILRLQQLLDDFCLAKLIMSAASEHPRSNELFLKINTAIDTTQMAAPNSTHDKMVLQ